MKPRRPRSESLATLVHSVATLDQERIDELYGLEPVFEPAAARDALGSFAEFQCPYCGEVAGTTVDLTARERHFIEDCHVCCRPMDIHFDFDERGELSAVTARRSD